MEVADVLRALQNPAARDAIGHVVAHLMGGSARARARTAAERDYERLHWGDRSRGGGLVELPPEPSRMVKLGALSRVAYVTRKGDGDPEEFVHTFGTENDAGDFVGPRPLLVVGFYEAEPKRQELFILRGRSRYSVTTHGIED